MKTAFEELESPYLDGEMEFVVSTNELSNNLAHAIGKSPFANFVGVQGTETNRPAHNGEELQDLETLGFDEPLAETWVGEDPEYEADEQPYDHYVLEEGDASTLSERLIPEPATAEFEPPLATEDPLAASTVFGAREEESYSNTYELDEEEVLEALPGNALEGEEGEETLRSTLDEAEEYAGETFAGDDYSSSEPPFTLMEEEERGVLDSIGDIFGQTVGAIRKGTLGAHVAIAKGERDEVKLTNLVFQARHQELPADYKIKPQETALRKEWTDIRDKIIRPALQSATEKLIVAQPFNGPYDPGFVASAPLKACVKGKTPDDWYIALVDLTNPAAPVYGGNDKDDKTAFAASLAKVAAMYAAFELRARVREGLGPVPVTTSLAMVVKALEKVWQPKLDAKKPAGAADFKGFPKLTQIFDIGVVAGAWKVDFTSKGSIASLGTNAQAEHAPFSKIDGKFGFKELLELMASFSNDEASARCITMLSYEYIHGALVTAGLYETGKGGLWLGASYKAAPAGTPGAAERNRTWMAEPTIKATEPNASRRFQVGSPKAFARMFTLLAQRKLVDPGSSTAMLDLLKAKTSDFIRDALEADGRGRIADGVRSKIGVIGGSYWCQTSFVQRNLKKAGKRIQYVIVILNNKAAPFLNDKATIGPLDQCILDRHPGAVVAP